MLHVYSMWTYVRVGLSTSYFACVAGLYADIDSNSSLNSALEHRYTNDFESFNKYT